MSFAICHFFCHFDGKEFLFEAILFLFSYPHFRQLYGCIILYIINIIYYSDVTEWFFRVLLMYYSLDYPFTISSISVFAIPPYSEVVCAVCIFPFHAFVLKQKVEPKIQAHSMRISSLCDNSFGEWAIGPPRNPTARALKLCLDPFHRTPVSRWSQTLPALNFSLGKARKTLKHTSEK